MAIWSSYRADGKADNALIISASYRTDIPAFYADWFAERLAAGYVKVANPYGGPFYTVSLRPADIDGFVFWTRNIRPFLPQLRRVHDLGLPFVVQFTLTGYPRALESAVPAAARAINALRRVADTYGSRVAVWRYDPILLSSLTPVDFHLANFAGLAERLTGVVDEVCVSFAHIYRKTRRNLDAARLRHDVTWWDPEIEEKRRLREELENTANSHGIRLTVCSQEPVGGTPARCVDARRLADLAGRPLRVPQKGNRTGCLCATSRDIGAYDTCPHGCVYCYAVGERSRAVRHYKASDSSSETLTPLRF